MLYLNLFLSFTKIAFLSFGGMTMIPIIIEEAETFGWLSEAEIMDIVAIAEITPGSLGINCATFVGLRTGGLAGALCATFGTLVPSLTLCLFAAHFIHKFHDNEILMRILRGIRPICLGMLLSIAATLSAAVYFSGETAAAPWQLILVSIVTGYALFKLKWGIPKSIFLAAVLGFVLTGIS